MEYIISNLTDIGIKDIQLKYIENFVEKSIYGVYCLMLYLIQKISMSERNNIYKHLKDNQTFMVVCGGHAISVVTGAILYYIYIS
tara:strand:- start:338 stop:592 length:255 start_codon:yes stop_codon:yes gene_type:complete